MPNTDDGRLLAVEAVAPPEHVDGFTGHLSMRVAHGWEEAVSGDDTIFRFHLPNSREGDELIISLRKDWPEVRFDVRAVRDRQWAMEWRAFFTPIRCGKGLIVLPPWLADKAPDDVTPIIIDPGTAFGTGHHATTTLMLDIIDRVIESGLPEDARFLDLGTGSGILGIACAKLGLTGVGLDIDELSVANAGDNIALNKVGQAFSVSLGDLAALAADERFELILANILAGPLRDMAADLTSKVAPGGVLALSGILDVQAEEVAAAYMEQGLPQPEELAKGEWRALLFDMRP